MTKEITKAIILQEIQDKLKLREFVPSNFLFDETVVPVYNIEPHLRQPRSGYVERSVTSTGPILILTVPQTQRRTFNRYDVVFMAAGAYTVSGIYVQRNTKVPADAFTYLDLTAGQTASYHIDLGNPIQMVPGDSIYINIDGYTSTQNVRFYYDYTLEEIR